MANNWGKVSFLMLNLPQMTPIQYQAVAEVCTLLLHSVCGGAENVGSLGASWIPKGRYNKDLNYVYPVLYSKSIIRCPLTSPWGE